MALFGPSKKDLQAEVETLRSQVVSLQEREKRFPRRNDPIASGVQMGWGDFEYEQNSKLRGADKYGVFDQMESDPHVKGILLDRALPLLTAEWEVKPASDKPKDVEIAEFVAANLLRQPSDRFGREFWIETSWKAQRLPEILAMLRDGFALFVSTWKRVGTKVVYGRLQWVEPATIDGTNPWELDDEDRIIAVNRQLETPEKNFLTDERIEADRLKLYVWDIKGARFEGRSFIRSMYGAWMRKEFILRQAAIWAQKVGAPVPVGYYPESWTDQHISRFKQFVTALRGSSPAEAYGMFPMAADGTKAEVDYAGSKVGEVDRMRGLVDGENREIHHGGRDSSSMLGETETGSRALGDSKGKKEIKLTQAIGEVISEWENHGVGNLTGVLQELVDRNYSVKAYPELCCTKIDPFENFGETIEAWNAGIIPKHEDARRQITEGTLGLNLPDEAYEIEDPLPAPTIPVDSPTSGDDSSEGPDKDEQTANQERAMAAGLSRSSEDFRQRIAHLLEPAKEGAPSSGGRFPDGLRAAVRGAGGSPGDVPCRGTGLPGRHA